VRVPAASIRYSSMLAEKNKPGSTEEAPSHAHTGVAGDAGGLQSPETGGSKQATEASPSTENRNEGGLASDYASRLPFTPDCPPGLEYVLEGRCRGVRQVGIGRYESRIVFNNIHYALGNFSSMLAAVRAFDRTSLCLRGVGRDGANPNFPLEVYKDEMSTLRALKLKDILEFNRQDPTFLPPRAVVPPRPETAGKEVINTKIAVKKKNRIRKSQDYGKQLKELAKLARREHKRDRELNEQRRGQQSTSPRPVQPERNVQKKLEHTEDKRKPHAAPRRVDPMTSFRPQPKPDRAWRPSVSHRLSGELQDAPIFTPTQEEFRNPLEYIASIRKRVEPYGMCKIRPPVGWRPPFSFKPAKEELSFPTKIQPIHLLQERPGVDEDSGGVDVRNLLDPYDATFYSGTDESEDVTFGFLQGPDHQWQTMREVAEDMKLAAFGKTTPPTEDIEAEFWRIVEDHDEPVYAVYASDLDTQLYGSGFPTAEDVLKSSPTDLKEYVDSEWNLHNLKDNPLNLLRHEEEQVPGVVLPYVYVGVLFSSFCWHVEDSYLYSINYCHTGAPKIWYGVPPTQGEALDAVAKRYCNGLFRQDPAIMHRLMTLVSPRILKREGVNVCRTIQEPGEFVVTLPFSYHCGFNTGFNCAEAVNFALPDWLPWGPRSMMKQFKLHSRLATVSYDILLTRMARAYLAGTSPQASEDEAGWLYSALLDRLKRELTDRQIFRAYGGRKEQLVHSATPLVGECLVCRGDLVLSAVMCSCHASKDNFACVEHCDKLCSCPRSTKILAYTDCLEDMNRAVVQLTRANASTGAKTRNCAGPIPPATLGVRQDGISKKCTALRLSRQCISYCDLQRRVCSLTGQVRF